MSQRSQKPDGVVYSFKNYSRRTDQYGFEQDVKNYEADPVQESEELEQLARTEKRKPQTNSV